MLARPMSRYSLRVLKTAPSQCVCGITQKIGLRVAAGSSALTKIDHSGKLRQAAKSEFRLIIERAPSWDETGRAFTGWASECNAQLGLSLDRGVEPECRVDVAWGICLSVPLVPANLTAV